MQFLMRKVHSGRPCGYTALSVAVFIPVKDELKLGALRKFLLMPMLWRLNGTYCVFSSFLLKML